MPRRHRFDWWKAVSASQRRSRRRIDAKNGRSLRCERLEERLQLSVTPNDIVQAFNQGIQDVRQEGQIASLVNAALGVDLPFVEETVAQIIGAEAHFSIPFANELPQSNTLTDVTAALAGFGFTEIVVGLTPDGNGNLLRAKYSKTWTNSAELHSDFETGFEYFDLGVDGRLSWEPSASLEPVTLEIILGVDLVNATPTFFVEEGSSLTIGGVEISGVVDANLGIRNLLDVDVSGSIVGQIGGVLTLEDANPASAKLRAAQFDDVASIVDGTLAGSIEFSASLEANLPIVGAISWNGSFGATITQSDVETEFDLQLVDDIAAVRDRLEGAYETIADSFGLFGGADLGDSLSGVGKGIQDVLGLPEFLTGGAVGDPDERGGDNTETSFEINVTAESIWDLINGKPVDLVRFESFGGAQESPEPISIPLLAAAIPIGPIPLTASLSFETRFTYGWSYYVGLGIDTVGFYIDPNTSISASGSIEAGLNANISLAGIAGANLSAGVGGGITLSAGLTDPDPRDGRIYLDELVGLADTTAGSSILDAVKLSVGGEAYAYARGVAYLLFWDWEIFNERSSLGSFSAQLGGQNQTPTTDVANSRRTLTQRAPLSSELLPDNLLQNGVLTIDTMVSAHVNRSNSVSITSRDNGSVEVSWRGVGQRTYAPGAIQSIVYHGNENGDRLFVGENVIAPVVAYGHGGRDSLSVVDASAHLYGGAGDDHLLGGAVNDWLEGGEGNDRLEGGGGADQLDGGAGDDVLLGGADNDVIEGRQGNDFIYGGLGDDHLLGGEGKDQLYGEQGSDLLEAGSENDLLVGGAGSDRLFGGLGNDAIFGDRGYAPMPGDFNGDRMVDGADFLEWQLAYGTVMPAGSGADGSGDGIVDGEDLAIWKNGFNAPPAELDGADFLYGDEGDDRLYGEGGDDFLAGDEDLPGQLGNDLLVGDGGNDLLFGRGGDDTIYGGDDVDQLHGGGGVDVLNGGRGADSLFGGAGEDTLQLDFASADGAIDQLQGGLDRDQIAIVGALGAATLDANNQPAFSDDRDDFIQIEQLGGQNFRAISRDPVTGAVLQTFMFAVDVSENADVEQLSVWGLGGDDRLEVLSGPLAGKNFRLDGGSGDDVLIGGPGRDVLYGGPGNDRLTGQGGDDALYGNEGDDNLDGGAGVDVLYGGDGNDYIYGGNSADGGVGRDILYGGLGNDRLVAGSGFYGSIIFGGNDDADDLDGNDVIIGSSGIDWLDGEGGDDIIVAGDMGDVIRGGAGSDRLIGELGRDTISGDAGDDFIYTHLNNEVRVSLQMPPLAELTLAERQSRYSALLAHLPSLQAARQAIVLIPASQRTEEQVARLATLEDAIAINQLSQIDLLQYQSVYVDNANGGEGDDSIHGSPNLDVLIGGKGDDQIYASRGYVPGGVQPGDVTEGGEGIDTLWYEGTDGDDRIRLFLELSPAGNNYVVVDLDGDGIRDGMLQAATIDNIGVNARAGDDIVSVDFGDLAMVQRVTIDAGFGSDYVIAGRLRRKLANGSEVALALLPSLPQLTSELAAGTIVATPTLQSLATLIGGAGHDTLIGGLNLNLIQGDAGDDTLIGGDSNDLLEGGAGNDSLFGNGGSDAIYGGLGQDTIYGGQGDDNLYGGDGVDLVFADAGNDAAYDSSGNDVITLVGGAMVSYPHSGQPTVVEPAQPGTTHTRVVSFSEPLNTTTTRSVLSLNNWALHDVSRGLNVTSFIGAITQVINPSTGRADVVLHFTSPLPVGDYRLLASQQIMDLEGSELDGASDGPGAALYEDHYIEYFTISASPLPLGSSVDLGSIGAADPSTVRIAVNPVDQSYVIVWQGPGASSGEQDVYARRYAASGAALGEPFRVNTFLSGVPQFPGDQVSPAISMDAAGNFVVVWDSTLIGAEGHVVYGRRFAANGTPLGVDGTPNSADQFLVDGVARLKNTRPQVSMDANGNFTVVWQGNDPLHSDAGLNVFAKRFSAQGIAQPLTVNSPGAPGDQFAPQVASDGDGDFVVAWVNRQTSEIVARHVSSAGNASEAFVVESSPAGLPDNLRIAMNRRGEFVIAWRIETDNVTYYARRYAANWQPLGDRFQIDAHAAGYVESDSRPSVIRDHALHINDWISNTAAGAGSFLLQNQQEATRGQYQVGTISSVIGGGLHQRAVVYDEASLDLQLLGGVDSISFSASLRSASGASIGFTPLVRQNGKTYVARDRRVSLLASWTSTSFEELSALHFIEIVGNQPGRYIDNSHPTLGVTGAALQVGYLIDVPAGTSGGFYVDDFAAVATLTSTAIIEDFDFRPDDWQSVVVLLAGGGDNSLSQVLSGGVPASRQDGGTVAGGTLGSAYQVGSMSIMHQGAPNAMDLAHFYTSKSINPQTLNGFDSLDFSMSMRLPEYGIGLTPAIRQNGKIYYSSSRYFVRGSSEDFEDVSFSRVRALEFWEINATDVIVTSHPDFSAGGAPIEVGFMVALSGGTITVPWSLDNFRASISYDENVNSPDALEVAIDGDGNFMTAWAQEAGDGATYQARWYDRWGNVLHDRVAVGSSDGDVGRAGVASTSRGEFIVTWLTPESGDASQRINVQRYTSAPPTLLSVPMVDAENRLIIAMSQPMAVTGEGSVLDPANWGLRLPDGRYIDRGDPDLVGDPRATLEQFGDIEFAFNETSRQWEVMLSLNVPFVPGNYLLVVRGSLEDSAGRRLDGNGDGTPGDDHVVEFSVNAAALLAASQAVTPAAAGVEYAVAVTAVDHGHGLRAGRKAVSTSHRASLAGLAIPAGAHERRSPAYLDVARMHHSVRGSGGILNSALHRWPAVLQEIHPLSGQRLITDSDITDSGGNATDRAFEEMWELFENFDNRLITGYLPAVAAVPCDIR